MCYGSNRFTSLLIIAGRDMRPKPIIAVNKKVIIKRTNILGIGSYPPFEVTSQLSREKKKDESSSRNHINLGHSRMPYCDPR